MRRVFASVVLLAASGWLVPSHALGEPCGADPSFGGTGLVVTTGSDLGFPCSELAYQDDVSIIALAADKVLIAVDRFDECDDDVDGDIVLLRYNTDGSLDASFGGGDGYVEVPSDLAVYARAVALQDDGKIVVLSEGTSADYRRYSLVRFQSDGILDTGFGDNGSVSLTDEYDAYHDPLIKVDQAGRLLVLIGQRLSRFGADGQVDLSFGNGGAVLAGPDVRFEERFVLQPDSGIVLLARFPGASGLVRYGSDGSIDSQFGAGGMVAFEGLGYVDRSSPTVLPDGKLVVSFTQPSLVKLARLNPDGTLDGGFGEAGVTEGVGLPYGSLSVDVLAPMTDGRLVALVDASYPAGEFIVRFQPDGDLDLSFGGDGIIAPGPVSPPVYSRWDWLGVQGDGSVVLKAALDEEAVALARYPVDGIVDSFSVGLAEFRVNQAFLGEQALPQVGLDDSGSLVVAWQGEGDGDGLGIFVSDEHPFDSSRRLEFQVNTYTGDDQYDADLAVAGDGRYLVTWSSRGQDGSGIGVFARVFEGFQEFDEFQVSGLSLGTQHRPSVAASDTEFTITWYSQQGIRVSSFTDAGAPVPGIQDLFVVPFVGYSNDHPVVAQSASGPWFAYMSGNDRDGSFRGIYSTTLATLGTEFMVNTYTPGDQNIPVIASRADLDGAVILWASLLQDGSQYGVYGQRYSAPGVPAGGEFQVASATLGNQAGGDVAMDAQGNFVAVWHQDLFDENRSDIHARRFDSAGNALGDSFLVNEHTAGSQDNPSIASDADGNFTIAWRSDSLCTEGDIFARTFLVTDAGETAIESSQFLTASVATPNAGLVSIRTEADGLAGPGIYDLPLGRVNISAPPASANDPLILTFELDRQHLESIFGTTLPSLLESLITVQRDGIIVSDCTGAPGVAEPDPCVAVRKEQEDGDFEVGVLTSDASQWWLSVPTGQCPLSADPACRDEFNKSSLVVKQPLDASKQRLVAKLVGGPALLQTDLGNPLDTDQGGTGTTVALCLYDARDSLVGALRVGRAGDTCDGKPCWKPLGNTPNAPQGMGRGYRYRDGDAITDGVKALVLKAGDAGRSKVVLKAVGAAIPTGITAGLQRSRAVTMQVRASDGVCLSASSSKVKKNSPDFFKAK